MRFNPNLWFPLAALAAGCMPTPVASSGSQTVRTAQQANIQGPFVPAGTRFSAQLDQELDTSSSPHEQAFSAVLQQPLTDSQGQTVVPAGARVHGHLHSVMGSTGVPRLRLSFENVEAAGGVVPIQVRVTSSGYQTYAGRPQWGGPGYDGYAVWDGPYLGVYGGGPGYYGYGYGYGGYYDVYVPREVRLPAGAMLNLELVRPLLGPSAHIASP
jgi:hypothetical protein